MYVAKMLNVKSRNQDKGKSKQKLILILLDAMEIF